MRRRTATLVMLLLVGACSRSRISGQQQDTLAKTIDEMVSVAASAGAITDEYSAVWSAAIQSGSDFSDRLREHRSSAEVKVSVGKLDQQFNNLEGKIKALRSDRISESLFRELGDAYELLVRLRVQASSPTGSLQSFNTNTAELASRIAGAVGRLRLYLPVLPSSAPK